VLIVLPDPSGVSRTRRVLEESFPGLRLWTDGVGLVWKEARDTFRPLPVSGTKPWGFLDGETDLAIQAIPADAYRDGVSEADTDLFVSAVRREIQALATSGKCEATLQEVRAALGRSGRPIRTEQQVGIAIKTLGLASRRTRLDGVRQRVYELPRAVEPIARQTALADTVPTSWPDLESYSATDRVGTDGRVKDAR